MRMFQLAVVKHLQAQRDPDGTVTLWKKICTASEEGGASAVVKLLTKLTRDPTSAYASNSNVDNGKQKVIGSTKPDMAARWRLDSIEIENFRGVLGKQRFTFSGLSSLVFGDNGVGKSTIALALEWALFGQFRRDVFPTPKPAFTLPVGTLKEGPRVEIVFSRGTDRLAVRRDDAKNNLILQLGRKQMQGTNAASALERALGIDADTFVRTVLLQQSRIRGLLLDDPKERNKALDRLIGMEAVGALLETINAKPFKEAAASLRDQIRSTEASFKARQEDREKQLSEATQTAYAQRFFNKDLSPAGLRARYVELGQKLMRVGEMYEVPVLGLPEVHSAREAKRASIAIEKECRRIRIESMQGHELATLRDRLGTLKSAKQRFSAALRERDDAQCQLDKLIEKHGDDSTRSRRCKELNADKMMCEGNLQSANELRSLLTQAKIVLAATSPDKCPVCEQPLADSTRVLRKLQRRIASLTTKHVKDIEARFEKTCRALTAHNETTKKINLAKNMLAERNNKLNMERRMIMRLIAVDGLSEKRVLPQIDKVYQRVETEYEKLRHGVEAMEKELGVIADADRALRDCLVPVLEVREALRTLEEDWKNAKANYSEIEKRAQLLESITTDIENIRKAVLTAKNESVSVTLNQARPRAQALYTKLVQHRLFDELRVKTVPRANKIDYSFEVSSGDIPKSGREARLVLSDGQMTAAALALFFALAESSQHSLDLLYVDDPTQNLDHPHKEAMAKVITDLATRKQIIVSTQDEDFVMLLRDTGFENSATVYNIIDWERSPTVQTLSTPTT